MVCLRIALTCAVAGFLACSSDSDNGVGVEPARVEGGGLTEGVIAGLLHVHVIDAASQEPLSGARVVIVGPSDRRFEGATDSNGLVTLEDDALAPPLTVQVEADARLPAIWLGVSSPNVTIPLEGLGNEPAVMVSGTLEGFSDYPIPEGAAYLAAVVTASAPFTTDVALGVQPFDLDQPSGRVCIREQEATTPCEWSMETRPGMQAHVVTLLAGRDVNGTMTRSDDALEVIGFAAQRAVAVGTSDITGETLTIASAMPVEMTADLPEAPSSEGFVVGVPGAGLASEGVVLFPPLLDSEHQTMGVPPAALLSMDGASSSPAYWVIARADLGEVGSSVRIRRGLAEPGPVTLEAFIDPPAIVGPSDRPVLQPAAGAAVHLIRGLHEGALEFSGILVGDATDLSPLIGLGATTVEVTAVVAPSEPGLRLREIMDGATALASVRSSLGS